MTITDSDDIIHEVIVAILVKDKDHGEISLPMGGKRPQRCMVIGENDKLTPLEGDDLEQREFLFVFERISKLKYSFNKIMDALKLRVASRVWQAAMTREWKETKDDFNSLITTIKLHLGATVFVRDEILDAALAKVPRMFTTEEYSMYHKEHERRFDLRDGSLSELDQEELYRDIGKCVGDYQKSVAEEVFNSATQNDFCILDDAYMEAQLTSFWKLAVNLADEVFHRRFQHLDPQKRDALLKWAGQNIYEVEMNNLAAERHYAKDWRTDKATREKMLEEIIAKKAEALNVPPKAGPLKQLSDILADGITGANRASIYWQRIFAELGLPMPAHVYQQPKDSPSEINPYGCLVMILGGLIGVVGGTGGAAGVLAFLVVIVGLLVFISPPKQVKL